MSLTAVLVVLVPAIRELSRAARSVEKLCDTLNRELPPTLESIRLTSDEINHLADDVNEGVQNASRVAQQVDQEVSNVRVQAKRVQIGTRSLAAGVNAAFSTLMQPEKRRDRRLKPQKRPIPPTSQAKRIEGRTSVSPSQPDATMVSNTSTSPAIPSNPARSGTNGPEANGPQGKIDPSVPQPSTDSPNPTDVP